VPAGDGIEAQQKFRNCRKRGKKRAIVEGFAEEKFFLGGCESSKESGSKTWWRHRVIGKTLKFDKT